MKLLDRYILREYLAPLTYCLVGFSMIFVALDLFHHMAQFLDQQTPPWMIARYYLSYLSGTIEYLAPASLLLATLYTLWRFTRHNELTAMRSSGVSLGRCMLPILGVGLAFSLGLFLLRETVTPRAFEWAENFKKHGHKELTEKFVRHLAYYNSRARREWKIEKIDLINPGRIEGLRIVFERPSGLLLRELEADRAEHLDGVWWVWNARVQEYGESNNPIGKPRPLAPAGGEVTDVPGLNERPAELVSELRAWDFFSLAEMRRFFRTHPGLSRAEKSRLKTDYYSRMAMPWICFIVTLLAVPTGARTGRQNALYGVFLVLGLFIVFYATTQIGILLGKTGVLPAWLGAWFTNVLFLGVGAGLATRMEY